MMSFLDGAWAITTPAIFLCLVPAAFYFRDDLRRCDAHHSDLMLMARQLSAPMAAPAVSASQSNQLDSRKGTKN